MATIRGGSDFSIVLATGIQDPVAPTVETTIVDYASVGNKLIAQVSCSGDVRAKWRLYVDGSLIETKRGDGRNVEFVFVSPILVSDGDLVEVKVQHYKVLETPSFEATIYGR